MSRAEMPPGLRAQNIFIQRAAKVSTLHEHWVEGSRGVLWTLGLPVRGHFPAFCLCCGHPAGITQKVCEGKDDP